MSSTGEFGAFKDNWAHINDLLSEGHRSEARVLGDGFRAMAKTKGDPNALAITFPVDGSRLVVKPMDNGLAPVALRASGGVGPLKWFINGEPLEETTERWNGEWTPDGIGFASIEAVDAEGRSATAEVFINATNSY